MLYPNGLMKPNFLQSVGRYRHVRTDHGWLKTQTEWWFDGVHNVHNSHELWSFWNGLGVKPLWIQHRHRYEWCLRKSRRRSRLSRGCGYWLSPILWVSYREGLQWRYTRMDWAIVDWEKRHCHPCRVDGRVRFDTSKWFEQPVNVLWGCHSLIVSESSKWRDPTGAIRLSTNDFGVG